MREAGSGRSVPEPGKIPASLEGDRLRLELLGTAHSEGMFELWGDPRVCQYSGSAEDIEGRPIPLPAASPAESDRLLDFWLRRSQAKTGCRWALREATGGEFAGAVGWNSLGPCCELAYHLIPRFWGRGLASEACGLLIAWAFGAGASEVEAFVEDENGPSIALLARLGFAAGAQAEQGVRRYSLLG